MKPCIFTALKTLHFVLFLIMSNGLFSHIWNQHTPIFNNASTIPEQHSGFWIVEYWIPPSSIINKPISYVKKQYILYIKTHKTQHILTMWNQSSSEQQYRPLHQSRMSHNRSFFHFVAALFPFTIWVTICVFFFSVLHPGLWTLLENVSCCVTAWHWPNKTIPVDLNIW